MCGNPLLDFKALRDAARYDGGYSRDTPVVRWLWEIVLDELSVEVRAVRWRASWWAMKDDRQLPIAVGVAWRICREGSCTADQ